MSKDPLLSELNKEQQKAVTTTEGPVLVLAGAGSGKTKVLTHRVAFLIREKKAYPEQILTVTFTNKAAAEIKERIAKLLKETGSSFKNITWAGTFHSICARILRIDGKHIGLDQNFTIYDPDDQIKLIKESMKELDIDTKSTAPRSVLATISSAKDELLDPEAFERHAKGYFFENVAKIYPVYQKKLEDNQALDFDDLIFKTVKLLTKNEELQKKYQTLFKYILVDEYQDTNYSQYTLIKTLSKIHQNIFVVGDDAQSIYKWRGADIRNILNFEGDFENTEVIKLEQNYRSTQTILDASNQVIAQNVNQKKKKLWTDKESGEPIKVYQANDAREEARYIAEEIFKIEEFEETAVLYRTNAQSRQIEEMLLKFNIPYRLVGNVRFYERKEIKDILGYLRVIANPADDLSLERIINTPKRGIGKQSILKVKAHALVKGINLLDLFKAENRELLESISGATSKKLISFGQLVQDMQIKLTEMDLIEFIKYVLETSELLEEYKDPTDENVARVENIKEFINIAAKYKGESAIESLPSFLEDISLLEDQARQAEVVEKAKVTLMTIHAAKGLEFNNVFVAGLEENLFPHSRSYADPTEMEEERRLAYVAFTRAKEQLTLTYSTTRTIFGTTQDSIRSRFIDELPQELLDYKSNGFNSNFDFKSDSEDPHDTIKNPTFSVKKGDRVKNEYFGEGIVLEIDDEIVKVNFRDHGIKELATEYASLLKL